MLTLEGLALLAVLASAGAVWQRLRLLPRSDRVSRVSINHTPPDAFPTRTPRAEPWGTFDFAVPDAGQAAVVDRIICVVRPHAAPPPAVAGWYVKQRAGDHLVFGFGTLLNDRILVVVAVGDRQFDCVGRTEVLMSRSSAEMEAPVASSGEMACLYDRIRSAVAGLGGISSPVV